MKLLYSFFSNLILLQHFGSVDEE